MALRFVCFLLCLMFFSCQPLPTCIKKRDCDTGESCTDGFCQPSSKAIDSQTQRDPSKQQETSQREPQQEKRPSFQENKLEASTTKERVDERTVLFHDSLFASDGSSSSVPEKASSPEMYEQQPEKSQASDNQQPKPRLQATVLGGTSEERGSVLAKDSQGNLFIGGSFYGTATFGAFSLTTSHHFRDIFLLKVNKQRKVLWALQGHTTGEVLDIAVANDGSIYITGKSNSSFAGVGTGGKIFFAHITSQGKVDWVKGIASLTGFGASIKLRGDNIYLLGSFSGKKVAFGKDLLTSEYDHYHGTDIFLAKLTKQGDFLWTRQIGLPGSAQELAETMEISSSGKNIYLLFNSLRSSIQQPLTITCGSQKLQLSSGGSIVILAKVDTNGSCHWMKSTRGYFMDDSFGAKLLSLDSKENPVIATGFLQTHTLPNQKQVTSLGQADLLLQKFDSNGKFLWAQSFGSSKNDRFTAIFHDADDNLHITGTHEHSLFFQGKVVASLSYTKTHFFYTMLKHQHDGSYRHDWTQSIAIPSYDSKKLFLYQLLQLSKREILAVGTIRGKFQEQDFKQESNGKEDALLLSITW